LLARKIGEPEIFEDLCLAAFGRLPRNGELEAAREHLIKVGDVRRGLEDLLWAMLNSPEFLFRH
jgi:hypothetical protein